MVALIKKVYEKSKDPRCLLVLKKDQKISRNDRCEATGKKFKNCLVLDFGTATTFDVIKNGRYEGGVIAPGVKLSIKNLSQATALLPLINLLKLMT